MITPKIRYRISSEPRLNTLHLRKLDDIAIEAERQLAHSVANHRKPAIDNPPVVGVVCRPSQTFLDV